MNPFTNIKIEDLNQSATAKVRGTQRRKLILMIIPLILLVIVLVGNKSNSSGETPTEHIIAVVIAFLLVGTYTAYDIISTNNQLRAGKALQTGDVWRGSGIGQDRNPGVLCLRSDNLAWVGVNVWPMGKAQKWSWSIPISSVSAVQFAGTQRLATGRVLGIVNIIQTDGMSRIVNIDDPNGLKQALQGKPGAS